MVKETDLKSVGHRPRRFEPCYHRFYDTVPEWLRGWTANPLGNALASSNLVGVVFFYGDVDQLVDRSLCMRKVAGSKPAISIMPD